MERPQPQPGKGEVRIRVHGATVNPTDLLLNSGEIARLVPKLPPFPYTPGMDAAGVIDAVGPEGDGRLTPTMIRHTSPATRRLRVAV